MVKSTYGGAHTMLSEAIYRDIFLVNAFFLLVAILNVAYLRLFTKAPRERKGPFISVVVPARNEAENIQRCIASLLGQDYLDYEVIVVDDQSEDDTAAIVERLALSDAKLKLVKADPLPRDWAGKQHAMAAGLRAARGELVIFTDADTVHSPQSLAWTATNMAYHRADFLSGYLRQDIKSLGEVLVVPTMFAMQLVSPFSLFPLRTGSGVTFGIGQYMAVRRAAFEASGGFEGFKKSIVDDISMARQMKASGARTVFLDARSAASVRLYTGFRKAFQGVMRSIFSAVGGTIAGALLVDLAILLLIVGPPVCVGSAALFHFSIPFHLVLASFVFFCAWTLVLMDRGAPLAAALLYPLVFFVLVLILTGSALTTGLGRGLSWKGRVIHVPSRPGIAGDRARSGALRGLSRETRRAAPRRPLVSRIAAVPVYWTVFACVALVSRFIFRTEVRHKERLRAVGGACFYVSNHSYFLDPAAVAFAVFPRRARFTVLSSTFKPPAYGAFLRALGAMPFSPGMGRAAMMQAIGGAFAEVHAVHVFPEGELTAGNRRLLPFKRGAFYLADRLDLPIIPIVLMWKRPAFDGFLSFFAMRLTVEILDPLYRSDFSKGSESSPSRETSLRLARAAQSRMQAVIDRSGGDAELGEPIAVGQFLL
jgi:chlorobactene glucosyltransferase